MTIEAVARSSCPVGSSSEQQARIGDECAQRPQPVVPALRTDHREASPRATRRRDAPMSRARRPGHRAASGRRARAEARCSRPRRARAGGTGPGKRSTRGRDAASRSSAGQRTEPVVGRSMPASRCSSVDFPEPDGPSTAIRSGARMMHDAPCTATTAVAPRPNVRDTSSHSTTTRSAGALAPPSSTVMRRPSRRADERQCPLMRAIASLCVTTTTPAPSSAANAARR